jgi:hypothetical protein
VPASSPSPSPAPSPAPSRTQSPEPRGFRACLEEFRNVINEAEDQNWDLAPISVQLEGYLDDTLKLSRLTRQAAIAFIIQATPPLQQARSRKLWEGFFRILAAQANSM